MLDRMVERINTSIETVRVVTAGLDALIQEAGGCDLLIEPRGYPHLGLAVLDAMFSLQSRYDLVVVPILQKYCAALPTLGWDDRFDESVPEHGTRALLDFLEPKSTDERCDVLSRNVAPGTTTRKADVCVEIAQVLSRNGVDSHASLAPVLDGEPSLEWKVRKISGVGPAAWRYLLNLSRIEKSKPDTMVVRWVSRIVDDRVSQAQAATLIETATAELQQRGLDVSVRTVDHLVWRKQTGRSIAEDPTDE